MPRQPPRHPVLSSRYSAGAPVPPEQREAWRKLQVNFRGIFHRHPRRPSLDELAPHYLYMGATGSGKTLAIKLHMASVLAEPDPRFTMRYRSLIYDPKTDLYPFLCRLGFSTERSVILTHPFDRRSTCWDLAADITSDADAQAFADVVIHDHPGQEFWQGAARDIVASTISGLNEATPKAWDLRDLVLIVDDRHYLEQVLARTGQGRGVQRDYIRTEDRLASSVRATLRANLAPYRIIAAMWDRAEQSFTFGAWARGAGVILIGDHYKYRDPMRRVNNLLVRYAIDSLMDRAGEEHHDLSWLYLDELKNAGRFPNFGTMLTQGRSKGIRCVLAAQGLSTLQATFPEHEEKEVINNCGNKCIMQLGSEEDAKWAERLFSTHKRVRKARSVSDDPRQPANTTFSEETQSRLEAQAFLELKSASNHGGAIHAYYHEPGARYYYNEASGDAIDSCMPPALERVPADFLPRPEADFTLRDFDDEDHRHLGLTPPPEDDARERSDRSRGQRPGDTPFRIPGVEG